MRYEFRDGVQYMIAEAKPIQVEVKPVILVVKTKLEQLQDEDWTRFNESPLFQ